jgi:predicted Zn-dependent peptidase
LLFSYHIPPGNTPDNYALQVLGNILGAGQSSRFYQHLVKEKQLAVSLQVQPDARIGPSLFYIEATPRPGVKPEDLEKAMYEEIEAVKRDGVTEQEMAKARVQFLRGQIQSRQSSLFTAIRLGQYAVYYDEPGLINDIYEKHSAVNAEQVKQAAEKYLVTSGRTVVTTLPARAPAKSAAGR